MPSREGSVAISTLWDPPPAAALPDAHFDASIARWYFVGGTLRRAVWADQRAGTAAAECAMPDWVARPRRSVGGYLVWLGKEQARPLLIGPSFVSVLLCLCSLIFFLRLFSFLLCN